MTGDLSLIDYQKITGGLHKILDCLACPLCRNKLALQEDYLFCDFCNTSYTINRGIPDLRHPSKFDNKGLNEWSEHWSESKKSLSRKFFSFYRKTVFARTVRHFVSRYFPLNGIFVEAGSGTSETSIRIDKVGGKRTLVAVDIVFSILERCHPIMDAQVCGDIFYLPFLENSIDGIWNVGVMEHFTHEQIDNILQEFYRVLRYGGSLILLWPGTDCIPQKLLHFSEKIIGIITHKRDFHFYPPEISQIRSIKECQDILARNRFKTLYTDFGFYSLMAFKTLIGEKK